MKIAIIGCLVLCSALAYVVPVEQLKDGYLVGDFESFDMKGQTEWRFTGNEIPGWYTSKGEVGYGFFYNRNWDPNTKVIELDTFAENARYYAQYVLPVQARYVIEFDYAAK